jgi:hypothetical protein
VGVVSKDRAMPKERTPTRALKIRRWGVFCIVFRIGPTFIGRGDSTPHEAPPLLLSAAGVLDGRTYPRPNVDVKAPLERALFAWKALRLELEHIFALAVIFTDA